MAQHHDVLIIETGAGGGTLAPSGKRVLWLERGDVLDAHCTAREVVDASFFPSIGAVHPALTAMANAIGVGERDLTERSA